MNASVAYFDHVTVFKVLRYKHFEHDNVVEISNRTTINFYPGLPHVLFNHTQFICMWCMYTYVRRMMYDTYIYFLYQRNLDIWQVGRWENYEVVSYLNSVLSTAVSQKSTHGLSTLQVCQIEGWALF